MRRCRCGNPTAIGRPNRYGVAMPTRWCFECDPPRERHNHHYRSTVVVGPAICDQCAGSVWYDRLGARWLDGDRNGHRCAA